MLLLMYSCGQNQKVASSSSLRRILRPPSPTNQVRGPNSTRSPGGGGGSPRAAKTDRWAKVDSHSCCLR